MLAFFISTLLIYSVTAMAQVNVKWSEGEHLELGETGALLACKDLGIEKTKCPIKNIPRFDDEVSYTYGELVSAADFYNSPYDLYYDEGKSISGIISCAHRLLHKHPAYSPGDKHYSECVIPAFLTMPGYLEVVTQNYNHFGWNNMTAYVHQHQLALNKASEAYRLQKENPKKSKKLFTQALIINGFADHYLTDAFSSGHVRVPRIQIKQWAIDNLRGLFKSTRGDILAVLLHDNESTYIKSGLEYGFLVKNAKGDIWRTRGDQHLHLKADMNDIGFRQPLEALQASFREILIARQTGLIPEGVFAATRLVPFSNDIALIEKYTPEVQKMSKKEIINALAASIPWFEKLIYQKSDFERMLNHLPGILRKFQLDIAKDVEQTPELIRRLPTPYLEAFKKVD